MSGTEIVPMTEPFCEDTQWPQQSHSPDMPINYNSILNANKLVSPQADPVGEAVPTPLSAVISAGAANVMPSGYNSGMRNTNMGGEPMKKKRGRPRMYGPDGTMATGISSPVVAVVPISQCYGGFTSPPPPPAAAATGGVESHFTSYKKAGGRPRGSTNANKKQRVNDSGTLGEGFSTHVLTVRAGEDVATKIKHFSLSGPRSICILSAIGVVSIVTLRQEATSGARVTYEGRCEILSLSGSFLVTENAHPHTRTGGLRIIFSSSDGRVLGGSVIGPMTAASPIQIVVGSFPADGQKEPETQINYVFSGRPMLASPAENFTAVI